MDYVKLVTRPEDRRDPHTRTGTALSMLANRVSYLLGLEGPSLTIDTACSSSLVAVHLACQSLRAGESELAIAGGVHLNLNPEGQQILEKKECSRPTDVANHLTTARMGLVEGKRCCGAAEAPRRRGPRRRFYLGSYSRNGHQQRRPFKSQSIGTKSQSPAGCDTGIPWKCRPLSRVDWLRRGPRHRYALGGSD